MMTPRDHGTVGVGPEPAVAGSFVAGLAAQDFGALGGAPTMTDTVSTWGLGTGPGQRPG